MAYEHNYFVRPVSGVWHVTWNDSAELIHSFPSQGPAAALAEILANHMRAQGKTAKVHVSEPEARRASWGANLGAQVAA